MQPSPAELVPSLRVDGRVAVVTGASSGLGDRFARVLHAAGAKVVVAARRVDRLEALASELDDSVAVACDVADDEQVRQLVARTVERFGRIDIVVNNAGMTDAQPAESEPIELFRQVIEVNLVGLFHLSQLAARHMLEQGSGTIINVASVLGMVASAPNAQAAYTASKGGVVNLTRELAGQWARRGIRVNALAPGYFASELTAPMFADERASAYINRNTPMRRPGEGHELDAALLYLASDASSYVTGTVLTVDGGWTSH